MDLPKKSINSRIFIRHNNVINVYYFQPSQYVRAAFSTATEADIDEALSRLANLLKEELAANGKK
jgi:DNA-binding transcriptional MocR family regulator